MKKVNGLLLRLSYFTRRYFCLALVAYCAIFSSCGKSGMGQSLNDSSQIYTLCSIIYIAGGGSGSTGGLVGQTSFNYPANINALFRS